MKILILGSEGFIGSNAIKYFKAKGHNVFGADIILKEEVDYFLINSERNDFSNIFSHYSFDACVNATGAANVQLSFTHPSIDFALNTSNVYNILDSIREYNPACKFLNLSSAAVYGNPVSLPIKEESELKPLSPYGYHKLYSEQICREFFELFNVSTISVRIFSAYGEGLQKQLFWDLYKKVIATEGQINMFGTGKETRDFIYIQDLLFALDCILQNGVFDGKAINVSSGNESSILDAVQYFVNAFNKKVDIVFTGNQKIGDPLHWRADISLLLTLGFKNMFSLEDGINNYCKWLKEKK